MSVPPNLTLPPGVRPLRLQAPGVDLALLLTRGGTARPVVLVPGFTGSKEDFLPLLPLVAGSGHPAVALDLPGQYQSPGPDEPAAYSAKALAEAVARVVEQAGRGTPVHLVGHSFGGLVCRRAVLDHGVPVASLALVGSGPAALDGQRAALIRLMRPLLDAGGVPAVWEASVALAAEDPRAAEVPRDVRDFLARRFLASPAAALQGMGEALLDEPDLVDELAATGLPMLVAHGEGDDAWPPPVQRHMAERLGAEYAVIPDALHSPAAEAPEALHAALLRFWQAVDARH